MQLLKEEMRRTLVTLRAKALWWEERKFCYSGPDSALAEGIAAYAASQALLQRQIADRFERMWRVEVEARVVMEGAAGRGAGEDEGDDGEAELMDPIGLEEEEGEIFGEEAVL